MKLLSGGTNTEIIHTNLDEAIQLIKKGDVDNEIVLGSINSNKHKPGFFAELQRQLDFGTALSVTKGGNIQALARVFREDQSYMSLVKITDSTVSAYDALNVIKTEIASYYQMLFYNIESAKNSKKVNEHYQQNDGLIKYQQAEGAYKAETDMLFVENFFVREDPLFWTALFLYQKELNFVQTRLSGISLLATITQKCYDFMQKEFQLIADISKMKEGKLKQTKLQKAIEGYENRKKVFLLVVFDKKNYKKLGIYKEMQSLAHEDISEKILTKSNTDSKKYSQLADKIRAELNRSEKVFAQIRNQAKSAIEDEKIISEMKNAVSLIGGKFHTKELSPFEVDIRNIRTYQHFTRFIQNYISTKLPQEKYIDSLVQFCDMNKYEIPLIISTSNGDPKEDLEKFVEIIGLLNSEKETLARYIVSPTINNEREFMRTVSNFANHNHVHKVINFNLGTYALGITGSGTLKGIVDRLCGHIAKTQITANQENETNEENEHESKGTLLLELPDSISIDQESMQNAQTDLGEMGISLDDLDTLTSDFDGE